MLFQDVELQLCVKTDCYICRKLCWISCFVLSFTDLWNNHDIDYVLKTWLKHVAISFEAITHL